MTRLLILSLSVALLSGCVLRTSEIEDPIYEPIPPPVAPVAEVTPERERADLSRIEAQINALLDGPLAERQRERLELAAELVDTLREGEQEPDEVVREYLEAIVMVEQAELDVEPEDTAFEVPELDPVAVAETDAQTALAGGEYMEAIERLEPYKRYEHAQWERLEPTWYEAVDGWVHSERERAGGLFVQAKKMPPGDGRDAAIREVEDTLVGLLADFPESSYVEAIERNLEKVRAAH